MNNLNNQFPRLEKTWKSVKMSWKIGISQINFTQVFSKSYVWWKVMEFIHFTLSYCHLFSCAVVGGGLLGFCRKISYHFIQVPCKCILPLKREAFLNPPWALRLQQKSVNILNENQMECFLFFAVLVFSLKESQGSLLTTYCKWPCCHLSWKIKTRTSVKDHAPSFSI